MRILAEDRRLSERKLRKGREILARLQSRTAAAAGGTPLDTGPHDEAYRGSLSADEVDFENGKQVTELK